jgi:hypothetical protein
MALIGQGRIGEAVGDDPGPGLERRPDRAEEVVAPRRADEQRLGDGVPPPGVAGDEQAADLLGAGRAARLARRDRGDSGAPQRLDEQPDLRRLSRPLAALEGDELGRLLAQANLLS